MGHAPVGKRTSSVAGNLADRTPVARHASVAASHDRPRCKQRRGNWTPSGPATHCPCWSEAIMPATSTLPSRATALGTIWVMCEPIGPSTPRPSSRLSVDASCAAAGGLSHYDNRGVATFRWSGAETPGARGSLGATSACVARRSGAPGSRPPARRRRRRRTRAGVPPPG